MGARKPQQCSIEVSNYRQKRWRPIIVILVVCLVLIIALLVAVIVLAVLRTMPPLCEQGRVSRGRDMESPGLFNDLTPSEMRAVRDFLLADEDLELLPVDKATVNSSYIFMIDLRIPLKTAVLGFTDSGRRKPRRAAIAVLYRGDMNPPRVEEYIVGPLPNPTYRNLATNPAYRRTPIPFSSRPVDSVERRELQAFLKRVTVPLHLLFKESYQLSYHNCTSGPDCMLLIDLPPRGQESGERRSWFWGYRKVEGASLHPLGFALLIDHESTDVSRWSVMRIIYHGQMFYEVEDLMDRYKEETIRKIRLYMDSYDRGFSSYQRRGPTRFDVPAQGPRLVEPDGRRFRVDDQFVEYFGWSFHFRSRTATGLQLFDVRFQDGRIAYELGLQEAAIFYSGHTPEVSSLSFYASSWLVGGSSFELLPGVDCPATAHFIDSFHFFDSGSPRRYRNSICLFEMNSGTPLRRHYTNDPKDGFAYYGGTMDHSLVLRTIAVIWNKDIILDYVFHLDGSLEVKVHVTGYLQTTYSLPRERSFGHLVYEDIIGNVHQDLFHFKLDLDIGGSSNRYKTWEFYTDEKPSFWFASHNATRMHHQGTVVKTEREAVWRHETSPLLHHVILNHKRANRYRSHRGYRIIHKSTTDFVLKSSPVARAAGWATFPLVVTKYKDIEESSSSLYAQGDPWDPVLDFRMYLEDNNTIVDEDLVVWATLGGTVIPRAEDVPSPTTVQNFYSLLLSPHNYFDKCPSTVVSDSVHIVKNTNGGALNVDTFGISSEQPSCLQDEKSIRDFNGDVDFLEH